MMKASIVLRYKEGTAYKKASPDKQQLHKYIHPPLVAGGVACREKAVKSGGHTGRKATH